MKKSMKSAWRWSPASFVMGVVLLILWLSSIVWSQGQNFPGGSSSPSPVSYTFGVLGGTTYAYSGSLSTPGKLLYTSTDAGVVFRDVMSAAATVGGSFTLKNGVYNVNTLVADPACTSVGGSGVPAAYAIGIPANTVVTSAQFLFRGESTAVWQGEEGSTSVNNSGVVINITPNAVSSVTAGDLLNGFWQSPVSTCALSATNASNDAHYENITVRFPVNTRGNEVGFNAWFNLNIQYDNVVADFNVGYNTIATGSAPTAGTYGSFGLTSTVSSSGNWQAFRNTFSTGYNIAYDFQSEHVVGETVTAIYSNYACEFGRSGTTVFHPTKIIHFVDQENGAGCIWGPQMQIGSITDVDFDFEFGNDANWYSTARAKTAKLSETNNGYGTGILRYQAVVANGGGIAAEIPASSLFTSGGVNFQAFEGTVAPNIAITTGVDSFTRPNSNSSLGLGPAWVQIGTGTICALTITSNAAVASAGAASCAWVPQNTRPDQFSQVYISALDTNAVGVFVRASTSANTGYEFYCATSGGLVLRKLIAGVSTGISTSATNCAATNTIRLDVIGTQLIASINGVKVMSGVDSSITSGYPGIVEVAVTDGLQNWSGGSLPLIDATHSIDSQPQYAVALTSIGTPPTPTGTGACATITTQVGGGELAGSLECTGTTGASTITLTFTSAQPHGYRCSADDQTTVADTPHQSAYTTTTCVLTTSATAANDVIVWNATGF